MIRFFILSGNPLKQGQNEEKCLKTAMFFSVQGQHLQSVRAEAGHHFCTASLNQLLYLGREPGLNTQQHGWTQTPSCQVKQFRERPVSRESEGTPGDGDGQGGLVCCDSWGRKESDTTERRN
jgi:hypothetical protein